MQGAEALVIVQASLNPAPPSAIICSRTSPFFLFLFILPGKIKLDLAHSPKIICLNAETVVFTLYSGTGSVC